MAMFETPQHYFLSLPSIKVKERLCMAAGTRGDGEEWAQKLQAPICAVKVQSIGLNGTLIGFHPRTGNHGIVAAEFSVINGVDLASCINPCVRDVDQV